MLLFGRHELNTKSKGVVLIGNKKRPRLFCCSAICCYIEWFRTGEESMISGSDLGCINSFAAGDVGALLM